MRSTCTRGALAAALLLNAAACAVSSPAVPPPDPEAAGLPALDAARAAEFAELALAGVTREFPNKPSHVMAGPDEVLPPRELHPAFYGSFDWHSSVHGHWMLARLLRAFPEHPAAAQSRARLDEHLTPERLEAEAAYFRQEHHRSFERMYGWAWYLQLASELHRWDDPDARRWREALRPLEEVLVVYAHDYLPKLQWPNRVGVHQDTGFALGMMLDYARAVEDRALEALILRRARDYYLDDRDYPVDYEPAGEDFFSSGLNEADLMRRVLPAQEFSDWLDGFFPGLRRGELGPLLEPVHVTDVTDGKIVHLAGLDLSRAWTLRGIASALPADDPRRAVLLASARAHADAGVAYVFSGHYAGEHWLASFAVYLLTDAGLEVSAGA